MLAIVEGYELGFWTTSAQIAAVLGLTLVIEVRYQFRLPKHGDFTRKTARGDVLAQLLISAVFILVAFFLSFQALATGNDDMVLRVITATALNFGFLAVLVGPLYSILVEQWWVPRQREREARKSTLPRGYSLDGIDLDTDQSWPE